VSGHRRAGSAPTGILFICKTACFEYLEPYLRPSSASVRDSNEFSQCHVSAGRSGSMACVLQNTPTYKIPAFLMQQCHGACACMPLRAITRACSTGKCVLGIPTVLANTVHKLATKRPVSCLNSWNIQTVTLMQCQACRHSYLRAMPVSLKFRTVLAHSMSSLESTAP
jgi:hypothetical protein